MAKNQKKSTKKFEKKHLKGTLERRKEFAKVKQRHQQKEKKQARRAKENAASADDQERSSKLSKKEANAKASEAFKDMTVDQFFQGGFELPELPKGKASASVTGKRKRGEEPVEAEQEEEDSESDDSFEDNPVQSDSESELQSDGEGRGHKADLEALAKKDPEFYKYLKENDAELLDFDDTTGFGELSEEEDERPKKKKKSGSKAEEDSENTVTLSMVQKWKKAMQEQRSLRAMRELILAFRAAVHSNDEEKQYKYSISSPEVYHQLLTVALKHIPEVVEHHLPVKETASGKVKVPTDSKKFRTLAPLLMAHFASLVHLLETLSDDGTLKLALTSINPLLPYLVSFKKVLKNLVKTVIGIWSETSSTEAARINAFLVIRRLAVIGDASIREALLKSAYQGLVKGSRNTTVHTLGGINLMKNSAVDLWGFDATLGYTTGFTYIRQLAIHLRTTMTKPTKDSYKAIYNWQYVHSLDFWSRAFSTHCSPAANPLLKKPSDSPLYPLIYPLVQVTLGALRLIPTPTYFPLRFQLIRSLLRISRSTNTYIPLAPALIEVLQSPEVKEGAKPSTIKPLDFATTLRAPKQYSRTRVYQEGIIEQVSELLAEFFGVWAKSVAFPELIIPPVVLMKRWMKEVSNPGKHGSKKKSKAKRDSKITASISLLIQKLGLNAEFIQKRRRKLEFAPKDREQLDNFLRDLPWEDTPMGAYVFGIRKRKEDQERLLEESRREEEERRRQEKEEEMDLDDVQNGADEEGWEEEEEEAEGGVTLNGLKGADVDSEDESEEGSIDYTDEEDDDEEDDEGGDGFIDDEAMEADEDDEDDEDEDEE